MIQYSHSPTTCTHPNGACRSLLDKPLLFTSFYMLLVWLICQCSVMLRANQYRNGFQNILAPIIYSDLLWPFIMLCHSLVSSQYQTFSLLITHICTEYKISRMCIIQYKRDIYHRGFTGGGQHQNQLLMCLCQNRTWINWNT